MDKFGFSDLAILIFVDCLEEATHIWVLSCSPCVKFFISVKQHLQDLVLSQVAGVFGVVFLEEGLNNFLQTHLKIAVYMTLTHRIFLIVIKIEFKIVEKRTLSF